MGSTHRHRALRRFAAGAAAALSAAALSAATPVVAAPASGDAAAGGVAGSRHRDPRINELQVLGSHNSYHRELPRGEQDLQLRTDPAARDLLYSHASLPVQLQGQAVRSLELDLHPDPAGGLYRYPLVRRLAGAGPLQDPVWSQPGTKVLHIVDVDYASSCTAFVQCLRQIRTWSQAHPGHVPVTVLLQLSASDPRVVAAGGVQSPPWDAARLDALDAEIRSVFGEEDMITPDDVRRPGRTLNASVRSGGWPRLSAARGQVLFLMDNGPGPQRDAYRAGRPSLQGRVMFTNGEPGADDTAFLVRNEPRGGGDREIADLARQGYLVRTRADVPLETVRSGDTAQRDLAFASGAHIVSTDFPSIGMAARYGSDYVAQLPGGATARCNPVTATRHCGRAPLER